METHQNASKSKCFDTRFYRQSWAHPQPKCGTSQVQMKYKMIFTLFYEGFIRHVPRKNSTGGLAHGASSFPMTDKRCPWFKGSHPIKGPRDVICCKGGQQRNWNSMIHFHWSGHTLSPFFLSNLSVFWMKDLNFLKARTGFAPLLFLYDS